MDKKLTAADGILWAVNVGISTFGGAQVAAEEKMAGGCEPSISDRWQRNNQ
jgi:hypothetical protein